MTDENRISELTRRDIVDWLLMQGRPFYGRLDLIDFLRRVWDLSSMRSTDSRFKDAEGDIWQHMVNNNDWTLGELLYSHLDILRCSDVEFCKFVETVVHPLAFRDGEEVIGTVLKINELLAADGFHLTEHSAISGRAIYKTVAGESHPGVRYEVVLSFAGEQREYVERVAAGLKNSGVSVFYDKYEEPTLWGKELTEHLQAVYGGGARFCVIFISKEYADKIWPTHERRTAFEKALADKQEYILPARFDDTKIPGLRSTIGYVDLRGKEPADIVLLILEKLGRVSR
jgi:hypothetical protein